MHVLFDITHPAHVHLFRYAIQGLNKKGHETTVLSRRKDLTTSLLDAFDIDHTVLSTKKSRKYNLVSEWVLREVRTIHRAVKASPDVIVSRLNPPAAHASTLLRRPNIVFDDSEKAVFPAKITHPFTDVICTPENFRRDLGSKQRRYRGFHELAYLHPNRFTPNADVLREHEIDPDEHYAVIRFVSWGAHHDVNQEGLSMSTKRKLIDTLSDEGDVYITSEGELPAEFEDYRLPVPPEHIHQLLYHANVYVGDSQTMATEAALLGTPSVRCNSFADENDMGNFVMLESEYDLLRSTADEDEALDIVQTYLGTPDIQAKWDDRRERLANDTVDVTDFMLEVIEEVANQ